MKLLVAGASGFVGTEIIRQSLQLPQVTTVVAIARKPVSVPDGADPARFKNVVVKAYGDFLSCVADEFKDATACIWTVGITPMAYKSLEPGQARRICLDDTLSGLENMVKFSVKKPFRFIYMSGADVERDQTKTPPLVPEYFLMRGEVENGIFGFEEQNPGLVEVGVARPGLIINDSTDLKEVMARLGKEVTTIRQESVAAALLHQALYGIEKKTLWTDDLKRIAGSQ
ncbi:hypothetical protein FVEN_g6351 [Fusarium venenatum]|uniref:NAD(P)-binding domain-containing protein n=1 Tax=Fusarium venenatum TaxID=56646 RepID=A0A2L2T7N0_9HYPO|nr:uncharacterized protein FVRRES_04603 [Fusarium venenatum]KAG8355556.1 hypothetical protein FVEN_g6351 [Fusarium venenatum]KAH6991759.1 hypothetical protein EDB82DRAFT_553602 [Fusarium venenatum]CEI60167.1 unnamed protein product [Fusarium venenatum]